MLKKRPSLLLEVLLAVAILGIAEAIIIQKPGKLFQKELSLLAEMEHQRLADLAFLELELALPSLHQWEELSNGIGTLSNGCAYRLSTPKKDRIGINQAIHRYLDCAITVDPKKFQTEYHYPLLVCKNAP